MDKTEKMFSLVDQFHNCNLSAKDFAVQHNIPRTTFLYWVQKKRLLDMEVKKGDFLPIKIDLDSFKSEPIEIWYPNGVKVLVSNPSVEQLREYIQLLAC